MNTFALPRNLVIFGIVIPLAFLLGYLMAEPGQFLSIGFTGIILMVLSIPIFLKWHYPLLILSWNFPLILVVLPGQPNLWILLAFASLFCTVAAFVMDRKSGFQNVPSITWPLMMLVLVVLVTATLSGGIGLRSLGGNVYGGRKFFFVLMSIAGYFAISAQRIPSEKLERYTWLFFLPGLASVVPNLAYLAGPAFWWLYYLFPVDAALDQAREDFFAPLMEAKFGRLNGLSYACVAGICFLYARYGLSGILSLRRWWRFVFFVTLTGLSMLGGFRSFLVIFGLTFAIQFMFERLYRTRLVLVLGIMAVLGMAVILPFANKLPLSMQRSLSFLPIEIDPVAAAHARGSLEWRTEMWRVLYPEIPKYFWIGKGYALDPTDLYLTQEAMRRGLARDFEYAMKAGDYHNGPLSILLPLGVFGAIGFAWFCLASIRRLYRTYRDGPERLKTINTFLLSYFVARLIFFMVGFGSLWSDLQMFTGLIALSIALNGAKLESAAEEEPVMVEATPVRQPQLSPL